VSGRIEPSHGKLEAENITLAPEGLASGDSAGPVTWSVWTVAILTSLRQHFNTHLHAFPTFTALLHLHLGLTEKNKNEEDKKK
jgi:hypothetical protein